MWVRGLKHKQTHLFVCLRKSHPVWVRGLKLCGTRIAFDRDMSHPVWVRGLKHFQIVFLYLRCLVAPCVGAWIETPSSPDDLKLSDVAPCVGAWIETCNR